MQKIGTKMRFKLIFSIVSFMTVLCGISMAIPAIVDYFYNQPTGGDRSMLAATLTVLCGLSGYAVFKTDKEPLRAKEMFLTTTLVWLSFTFFSALPFYFSIYDFSFTDAFFESMSGLTTTGATVITGLDTLDKGLLIWRSLTQWLGGLGIIVVVLTVFPTLHIGGLQFFTTESADKSDRSAPKIAQMMRAIISFFLLLSIACAGCLWLAGMTPFDAINHSMTTIATGGFSTKDASIGFYHNTAIEWIITLFMAVSGLPLIIGLLIWKQKWQQIKNNEQITTYFWICFFSIALISLYRWYHIGPMTDFGDILRSTTFAMISVITTSGFVTENYMQWGNFAIVFFLMLLMTGACTGSTSGGIKMFRYSILLKTTKTRMKSMAQPYGVFIPRYGEKPITDDILIGIMVFIGLYFVFTAVSTLALSLTGLDLVTSLSGSLSALSNVGPALGHIIGPDKTFASLPDAAKWIMSVDMLLGRLEFITVLMIFTPYIWKKNI